MTADEPCRLLVQLADAMYVHDGRGRTTRAKQWHGGEPPRLHLFRSGGQTICRLRADLPGDVANAVEALAAEDRGPHGQWSGHTARLLAALAACGPIVGLQPGLIYRAPSGLQPRRATVAITRDNADLLVGTLDAWLPDIPHAQPMMVAIADGRAAAVCASVRITPHVHVAGVETAPDARQRGHAATAVAGWARAVHALGALPIYSTAYDNLASQGVARRLGLELFATELTVG